MKNINYKSLILKYALPFVMLLSILIIIPLCIFKKDSQTGALNSYQLSLNFDQQNMELSGHEEIVYVNNSENLFTNLYFHLYPNAFRENAKNKVIANSDIEKAYPNGLNYGDITIKSVADSESNPLNYLIEGEDMNILNVSLVNAIYPDEQAIICIDFVVKLANINHRLGYGENTINFGNFYPIACVYEDGIGFYKDLYHSNGDPFYSDCANYDLTITFDKKFDIAVGGDVISSSQEGSNKCYKIKANNVRDFCFVLSENFSKISEKIDGVEINFYGYDNDVNLSTSLAVAVDALKTFNKMFGKYPYKQLSVVKSNFIQGGMEYPQLVLISDAIETQEDFNYVIVHEIAHQWWYGVVGNDEYNHAWLDEGLAEYSTLLFFKENSNYGEDYNNLIKGATESYKLFEKVYLSVTGKVDGRMERAICDFETEPEYVQCTYTKSVLMYHSLKESIGENKFLKALQSYYEDFSFKNATPADLIATFVKYEGKEIESFFNSWLEGKVVIK